MPSLNRYFDPSDLSNRWSAPVNMGAAINTKGDDVFPFSAKGKLYFSSNGHPGMGGLDVFVSLKGIVKNIGHPINSGADDFSFSIKNNVGYFASNSSGGFGHDDLYTFSYTPVVSKLSISIKSNE